MPLVATALGDKAPEEWDTSDVSDEGKGPTMRFCTSTGARRFSWQSTYLYSRSTRILDL